jgi:hypothetical protein
MEDDYYPYHLAEEILKRSSTITKIQLFYEMPRNKVVSASCAGMYVIEARKPAELKIGACGKMVPASSKTKSSIVVIYEYGDKNLADIRQFKVSVVNTQTGETLAQQRSFQLLLGNMSNPQNRVMYGWGSAQGARTCKLTKPADFLLKLAQPLNKPI